MYKNPICDRLTQQENSSFFTGSSEAAQGLGWVDLALGFAFLRVVFILRLVVIVIPGVTAGQGKVQKGQNGSCPLGRGRLSQMFLSIIPLLFHW